jgi:DNA-binding CsgD family transcriptional regulator
VWLINTPVIPLIGLAEDDPLVERHLLRRIEVMAADVQVGVLVQSLETLVCVGDLDRAVTLAAATAAARERYGYRFPIPQVVEQRTAARLDEARSTMGGAAVDALWAEGSAMDLEAAAAHALRRSGGGRPGFGWEALTPAELVVVDLVAEGLTNPQIAERLVVSTHTVKTHLQHVFAKLDVRTRSELAAAAVARRNGA